MVTSFLLIGAINPKWITELSGSMAPKYTFLDVIRSFHIIAILGLVCPNHVRDQSSYPTRTSIRYVYKLHLDHEKSSPPAIKHIRIFRTFH